MIIAAKKDMEVVFEDTDAMFKIEAPHNGHDFYGSLWMWDVSKEDYEYATQAIMTKTDLRNHTGNEYVWITESEDEE